MKSADRRLYVSRDRVRSNGSQSEISGTGEISDSDAVAEKNGNGVSSGRITESEDTRYSLFFEEETPGLHESPGFFRFTVAFTVA